MISIQTLYWLLLTHYIADFTLQTTYMSKNKSTSNKALGLHCLIYGLCFLWLGFVPAFILGSSHFIIDYISSRLTSWFFKRDDIHNFFVIVGADQFLHSMVLFAVYLYFN